MMSKDLVDNINHLIQSSNEILDIIDVFKDFITEQHNRYHWGS